MKHEQELSVAANLINKHTALNSGGQVGLFLFLIVMAVSSVHNRHSSFSCTSMQN
jgi:hypothetical protein